MNRKSKLKINNPPADYISAMKFHKKFNQLLLVSSWDSAVSLYDTECNCVKFKWVTDDAVMDCLFLDPMHIAYSNVNGAVRIRDANLNVEETVGVHKEAAKSIEYIPKYNVLVSGSWDKTVKVWDLRQKGSVATYDQFGGKVFSMSAVEEKIAVGTSGCVALIWDLRNMKKHYIRQTLKHQMSCIALSPNKENYVIGHSNGRIAIQYIKRDPEVRKGNYKYKCHRMMSSPTNIFQYVYSVTALAFHHSSTFFASGGSNGYVNIWDNVNKKRFQQHCRYVLSIAALAYSHDGTKLAVASSERNIEAISGYQPSATAIRVVQVDQQEIRPRSHSENAEPQ